MNMISYNLTTKVLYRKCLVFIVKVISFVYIIQCASMYEPVGKLKTLLPVKQMRDLMRYILCC